MKKIRIFSNYDGLSLAASVFESEMPVKAIVCFSHGMAEHKERYYDFMQFLCENGYTCVIHDHRGHGESIRNKDDYGYFYTEDSNAICEDLNTVIEYSKAMYPNTPVYLFSHSMGTLVARCYLKKYDTQVDKVVLCGPPTRNNVVGAGLFLAKASKLFGMDKKANNMLNKMCFSSFNKGYHVPNSWLSVNTDNVTAYNDDPLCGYTFTTNGFINLFNLQRNAFISKDWECKHTQLPFFVIAGSDDPCIGSGELFTDLLSFLKNEVGYSNISYKLYYGKRHEILNENNHEETYRDILDFYNGYMRHINDFLEE